MLLLFYVLSSDIMNASLISKGFYDIVEKLAFGMWQVWI